MDFLLNPRGFTTAWLDLNTTLPCYCKGFSIKPTPVRATVTTDPAGVGKACKASGSVPARALLLMVDNPAGPIRNIRMNNTQKNKGGEGTGEDTGGREGQDVDRWGQRGWKGEGTKDWKKEGRKEGSRALIRWSAWTSVCFDSEISESTLKGKVCFVMTKSWRGEDEICVVKLKDRTQAWRISQKQQQQPFPHTHTHTKTLLVLTFSSSLI